jgi:hypothetical protein
MRFTAAAAIAALVPTIVLAQTSFPMVTHVNPVAIQRGTTAEVTVQCQTSSLAGAYMVLFEGTGLSADVLPAKETKPADPKTPVPIIPALKLKLTAAADAPLGVREFRIAAKHGISSLGQIVIVDAPVVAKLPGINTPEKAQPVTIPCVACGRIEAAENVDYYKFTAKAGVCPSTGQDTRFAEARRSTHRRVRSQWQGDWCQRRWFFC